jgi:UDP-glucose 4-epimerase
MNRLGDRQGRIVLVTGGAGFIGSHSVEALLAAGHAVRVLDNFSSGKPSNLPGRHPSLEVVSGDVRDPVAVARAVDGVAAVLHLAAQVSVQVSVEHPVESATHNVLGFVNVLECARRADVRRVVYASSAAVFGTPRSLPLDEESPLDPISPYGLEKRIDEQYGALFRSLHGVSSLGLRYFNVYGPRQDPSSPYSGVISRFARAAAAGEGVRIFGDGGQTRDFVYVGDIAAVNVRALESEAEGVCNVGTGRSVSLLDMVDALEGCVGRRIERRFEPPAKGDIRDSATSTARLHAWLGFVPEVPLARGLARLLAD